MDGRMKFFLLVKEMREQQKEYFETKSMLALNRSIKLEKEVDEYIRRGQEALDKPQPEQKELF